MSSASHQYPDISDIVEGKAAGRRAMAALSFEENLDILDRMRENAASLGVEMREAVRRSRRQENT